MDNNALSEEGLQSLILYSVNSAKGQKRSDDAKDLQTPSIYDRFNRQVMDSVLSFHRSIPGYSPTPLIRLKGLASSLGISKVYVKDESHRFMLNAFKVLGSSYAIAEHFNQAKNGNFSWKELIDASEEIRSRREDLVLATATDGNHGYGVAWMAKMMGIDAVIYMPKGTTYPRIIRTRKLGAVTKVLDENYDGCIKVCRQEATKNGWLFIQDFTLEDYKEPPLRIMQGYSTIISEVSNQLSKEDFNGITHLFIQAGVGSFAGGILAALKQLLESKSSFPRVVIVEPRAAHCFYLSNKRGRGMPEVMEGDLSTVMAGLSCGTPCGHGWEILKDLADLFISCKDDITIAGMRSLYFPTGNDTRITSGESGAVCVGALQAICVDPQYEELKKILGLDESSKVLLFSTEGDTDPDHFQAVVKGKPGGLQMSGR